MGFFDALDYTNRREDATTGPADTATPVIVDTYMAHHQGMTLVALANALLDDGMVARFHADSQSRGSNRKGRTLRCAPSVATKPKIRQRWRGCGGGLQRRSDRNQTRA